MQLGISMLALLSVLIGERVMVPQEQEKKITQAEIKTVINSHLGPDECESLDQIHIDHLEYFNFTGNGHQEAVVVASTCLTGTAGPDVHAVYTRNTNGEVAELPFLDARGNPPPFDREIPVFGNPNYGLTVAGGELVAHWNDSSDREDPVVVWYKWDGRKFIFDHMKVEGPFPTSYDCAKATRELDRAICYAPKVAALDVELGHAYQAATRRLPSNRKQQLLDQQREWLAQREKGCPIYKWWVDCLADMYTKRIAELNADNPH